MAILRKENGNETRDFGEIQQELADLNIQLKIWPVGNHPELKSLLSKDRLIDNEKEQVLYLLNHYFEELQNSAGYRDRDLIVLHSETPQLDEMLAKFDRCHTHDDDEVRYIVDGEGVFGFIKPDGSQISLQIQAGEYINVPKNTEHWFVLTNKKRIKAVRYFTSTDGWTPIYTDTTKKL